ncbi:hypothetical protein H2199_008205 [Coniosporium tulheliwenetii]|uniref:Uncharacterized protein n=1 Tax=Coniosporium tulheliwenetii TaxID=3383036 RepID=A0ACC2YKQ3_9PEZI|nr:hypothetical protein H2199_008205 [Cladosporium sp. JES 115]
MLRSTFILYALWASVATAASVPKDLKACVQKAFAASDPDKRIVSPGDATYTDARMGEKIQFDEFPALIAYAKEVSEVGPLVKCALKAGYKPVARAGGHHFLAYSALNNSLVIDLAHVNHVQVSADKKTAAVGSGIRLGGLYTALGAYGATFVGGICPTVGLGGLISAGGFGMQMRALGMAADYVASAKVILADGTTVVASPTSHPDLFWAIRGGGGGTYGIVVEYTLKLSTFPRSAMLYLSWNETWNETGNVRYDVAKRFLAWGPAQPKEFTSQVNVFKNSIQVVGWYLGGSAQQLGQIVNASGLLEIGSPQVVVSGGCNTDNSRLFGYTTFECLPDDQVDASIMNVIPEPYSKYADNAQFTYEEVPNMALAAHPASIQVFFMQKSKPLTDDVLKAVVDRIGQADDGAQAWGEWHAWNLSSTDTGSAFAWRHQALAHLEFIAEGSEDAVVQEMREQWFADVEGLLRPAVGPASYPGFMDADISVNPLTAYYGSNVCRLVGIKSKYDPGNVFTNPSAIPPKAPQGISC